MMVTTTLPQHTAYPVEITIECSDQGNGQCDGFSEDGHECECLCHETDCGQTFGEVAEFHAQMWDDAALMHAQGY